MKKLKTMFGYFNRVYSTNSNMVQHPLAFIMCEEFNHYLKDHHSVYTKQTNLYLVSSFMTFSAYYFNQRNDPYEYDSYYTRFPHQCN